MCTRRPLAQPPSSLPRNLRRIAHGGAEPADEGATRGGNDRPLILPTRRPIRRPPSGPHLGCATSLFAAPSGPRPAPNEPPRRRAPRWLAFVSPLPGTGPAPPTVPCSRPPPGRHDPG